MNETLRPLTEPEMRALRMFVLANGRTWKSKLNLWWQGGVVPHVQYAHTAADIDEDMRLLYCLRNTHGPTWLSKLRYP